MKILMIHQDRDELYGAVHSMMELLNHLNREHNVEPILLTSKEGNVSEYCKKMGWKYYVTGHSNFMIGANTLRKKIIRALFYPFLYLRYKLKNIRAISLAEKYINFEEIDLIHTNVNVCDIGIMLAKKHNIPNFLHLREFGDLDYNRISFRKNYIHFMNKNVEKFFAISDAVKEHWIKKGLDQNKVIRVYNGVEKPEFNGNRKENKGESLKIVFAGSISESKGQYLLIEAMSKLDKLMLKSVNVDIIGDGPTDYVKELKKKVKKYKLEENINFLGYQSNVRELLPDYDIGIMCSKSEGFGRVTIEYMMAGLCVIASNSGANKELIVNNENGLLFDYPDVDSLYKMLKLVISNKDIAKKIGEEAKKYALDNFTAEINAKNIYNAYCSALER